MMTDWHDLQHVLMHRLAGHKSRVQSARDATLCVVASPIGKYQSETRARCAGKLGATVTERLRSLGAQHCPGLPLIVVDGPDADGSNTALCSSLWSPRSCADGGDDVLVRVTGNAPGLQSEVASGLRRGLCRRLVVPYLAHARTPLDASIFAKTT